MKTIQLTKDVAIDYDSEFGEDVLYIRTKEVQINVRVPLGHTVEDLMLEFSTKDGVEPIDFDALKEGEIKKIK